MDENKLLEACLALAENLMWEKDTASIEEIEEETLKLYRVAENLVSIGKSHFYQVEALPEAEGILLGAIKYLEALAIPPLRENYEWFEHSLVILLELACPGSGTDKVGLPFFISAKKGIEQLIEWANEPNDE